MILYLDPLKRVKLFCKKFTPMVSY